MVAYSVGKVLPSMVPHHSRIDFRLGTKDYVLVTSVCVPLQVFYSAVEPLRLHCLFCVCLFICVCEGVFILSITSKPENTGLFSLLACFHIILTLSQLVLALS